MKRFFTIFVCAVLVVLAGCASKSSSNNTTASASSTAASASPLAASASTGKVVKQKVKIGVGGGGSMVYMAVPLAKSLGYFDEQGIDAEVIDIKTAGAAVQALISGDVDFVSSAFEHDIKARVQGKNLSMVALYVQYPAMSLVVSSKYKGQINTIQDLKGKKVGTSSVGSSAHYNLLSLLKKNGLSENDVTVVFAGLAELPAVLSSGQIDAGMSVDPYTTQMTDKGQAYYLYDLGTKEGGTKLYNSTYAMSGMSVRDDYKQKNPEIVQKMVNAIVKAINYTETHTGKEVASAMPQEFTGDKDVYAKAVEHMKESFAKNAEMTQQTAETTLRVLEENGIVKKGEISDVSVAYDMKFVTQAKNKLK